MWVPMVLSAAALAAGLVGIVLTGDWKLLLVLPVGMGLTHGLTTMSFREVMKGGEFRKAHPKVLGWVDAVFSAFILSTALAVPMELIGRFTAFRDDGQWVKICWFAGVSVVPWGYGWRDAAGRFVQWVAFACVAAESAGFVFSWRNENLTMGIIYAGMAAILVRRWIVSRKEVAA